MQDSRSSERTQSNDAQQGRSDDQSWLHNLTPARLLQLIVLWIFVGETASMLMVHHLPPMTWAALALLDATVLLILLSPAYFLLYRPLKIHHFERERAEREVAFLSRHVLRAVEEEKKRIAHELHDECGQVLTAMQFGIETLKLSIADTSSAAVAQCDRLSTMTAQLANEVRSLTARLRPAMLENCGLVPALHWHVDQLKGVRPEMRIDLQIAGCADRLPPDIEITVYRLCQEGLNNIFRHAHASRVEIAMHCGEIIHVRIEDNGVGFDTHRKPACDKGIRGFGLLGMRERVADLGGRLTVRSAPGQGTTIEAELPVTIQGSGQ
jgi:signal transduction histidine kinase